jgi:hypothetical protein
VGLTTVPSEPLMTLMTADQTLLRARDSGHQVVDRSPEAGAERSKPCLPLTPIGPLFAQVSSAPDTGVRSLGRNGLESDGHRRRFRPTYRCALNQLL